MGAVGHTGSPMAGKIAGFQPLEKAPSRSLECECPVAGGDRNLCPGGTPDPGQQQEEALRHGTGGTQGTVSGLAC